MFWWCCCVAATVLKMSVIAPLHQLMPKNAFSFCRGSFLKEVIYSCRKSQGIFMKRMSSSLTRSSTLHGVFPPIITTFHKNEVIAYDKLKENLEKWEKIPFRGYVVLGSTGEFASLGEEERLGITKFVRQNVPSSRLVIAGSGCQSTKNTIEMTQKMANFGVDAVLVISPSFYKSGLTEEALYHHFTKVADYSPIPVILYNVPANTNIDLSPSLVIRLSDHPNIIGLKDSGGDISKIGYIVYKTESKGFQVLAGSAGFFYPALCVGCVGGVLALANSLGGPLCDLYEMFYKQQHEEACKQQYRLIAANTAVTKRYGIPGVKASMDLLGYYGGPVRLPLQNLSEDSARQLKYEFESSGFL